MAKTSNHRCRHGHISACRLQVSHFWYLFLYFAQDSMYLYPLVQILCTFACGTEAVKRAMSGGGVSISAWYNTSFPDCVQVVWSYPKWDLHKPNSSCFVFKVQCYHAKIKKVKCASKCIQACLLYIMTPSHTSFYEVEHNLDSSSGLFCTHFSTFCSFLLSYLGLPSFQR